MKPTVYIETTIVGHLTSRLPQDPAVANQMWETREWWSTSAARFDRFISQAVIDEILRGDSQAAKERAEMVRDIPLLPISQDAIALADFLIARHALPAKSTTDALHLAIAATNGMRYLLTWNCKHLANAFLRATIESSCRSKGFEPPIICTPAELELPDA